MEKRLSLTLVLVFVHSSFLVSQDYSFYNYSNRISLNPSYRYVLLKFGFEVTSPEQDRIIYEVFGSSVKSKHVMQIGRPDGSRDVNIILELKTDSDPHDIRERIAKQSAVKCAGIGFQNGGKTTHFTTDEVVVKFKDNVSIVAMGILNQNLSCSVVESFSMSPVEKNVYLVSLNSKTGWTSESIFELSRNYASSPLVEYAQPNFIRWGMLLTPNDSLIPWMWHIKNTGNNIPENVQGIPGCDANVDSAWNIVTGNTNILVAVIDTGVDTNHTDLRLNLCDRSLWYDAYDEDQKPFDEYYHGTGVSGVCSAVGNNFIGTAGVSFTCKLMPVRVFGPYPEAFTTDWILGKGLNWSWTHGAAVLNNSWGGGIPTPLITNAIRNAVRYGRNGKGAVVVAGAGNDNRDTLLYPASMPEVIAAGGLSPCNERKSPISCDNINNNNGWGASYGEGLSIVAPTTYIATTTLFGGWCICGNGTSVASPVVAGIAALILTKNIDLSSDSVTAIIERSAKKVGNYSYNILKPHGLWNYEMGYGRIDAKSSLDMTPPGPSQIFDQSPPIISTTPPESGVLHGDVIITANITDNEFVASGVNLPRLYYSPSNSHFQIIPGIIGQGNNYSFVVPALGYGTRMYYYIAAQDTSTNGNVTTYPIGGNGVNPPGTVAPSKMLFLQNTDFYTQSFSSTNVPLTISEAKETTVVSFLNNPVNKTILDINCLIDIDHSNVGDISVSLISPSGTEIVLAAGIVIYHDYLPELITGEGFKNTVFDDGAGISITDSNYGPPYTGRFKPIDHLWFLNGEYSAGDWRLKIVDNVAGSGGTLNAWKIDVRYSLVDENTILPLRFALVKNYPNPFNPATRIIFDVPYPAKLKIVVHDILGRQITTLVDELRQAASGDYVDFNSHDFAVNGGRGLPSGVYFYSLYADGKFIDSKKMILLK